MRFYSFTNLYTPGIHAGIQTAHAIHEMISKYYPRAGESAAVDQKIEVLNDWLVNHKTIIVLNGGYHDNLNRIYRELTQISADLGLPLIRWRESREALNGATTAVGIVVPPLVYFWNEEPYLTNDPEANLYRILKSCPLAT